MDIKDYLENMKDSEKSVLKLLLLKYEEAVEAAHSVGAFKKLTKAEVAIGRYFINLIMKSSK